MLCDHLFSLSWLFPDRLEYMGWWRWTIANGSQLSLKGPLHHDLSFVYNNCNGRELTVAFMNFWPIIQVVKAPDGSLRATAGTDAQILNTIADKLNLT